MYTLNTLSFCSPASIRRRSNGAFPVAVVAQPRARAVHHRSMFCRNTAPEAAFQSTAAIYRSATSVHFPGSLPDVSPLRFDGFFVSSWPHMLTDAAGALLLHRRGTHSQFMLSGNSGYTLPFFFSVVDPPPLTTSRGVPAKIKRVLDAQRASTCA